MEYQLQQTGQEVQDILNQAPNTEENLQNEITRSTDKDNELETAIENEQTRAEGVESGLQTAIDNEVSRAEGVEGNLQTSITNEKNRAEGVEGGLRTDVNGIEAKIPTGASEQNKLATESFVNSSISTNTADFKGTYNSIEELQTEVPTATANDYAFVISTDAIGNTVYNRYKYVAGEGWQFEYALNNSSFTAAQWSAINSAITAALVAKLNGLPTAAELTQRLNAIIDSVATEKTRAEGIEAGLRTDVNTNAAAIVTEKNRAQGVEGTLQTSIVAEENRAKAAETLLQQNINAEAILRDNSDDALQAEIDEINAKIPTQASASNQLADKAFVNSSIATNTGEFKGTYNSLAELQAVTNVNANDYGFVIATDGTGNTVYNRYKYVTGQGWVFEYALNNSSFTAAQWGAINSGITAALAAKINGLPDIDALNAMFTAITSKIPANASSSNKLVDYAQLVAALAAKQDNLIFDNVPTENSNNPVKSGGVYSAIAIVTAAVVGLQSSKQDVLTFDQYPTPGSNNPVRSTGIYSAIENAVAPKANQTDLDNAVIRISTNEVDIAQLQAAYRGLTQNDVVPVAPTDTWPVANPQENVIYRVADRTNTPPQYYTDYMWNGTVMVKMAQYDNAIDPRPKKASQNLVTSGGVFDNMGALDVSELNATENPHTLAIYADLSAALAAIPAEYQKGGMSIKFIQGTVQSSDNKYVQYRLMLSTFNNASFANPNNWQSFDAIYKAIGYGLAGNGLEIELGNDNLITVTLFYKNNQAIWYELGNKSVNVRPTFSNNENIVLTFTRANTGIYYIYYNIDSQTLAYTSDYYLIPSNSIILESFFVTGTKWLILFTLNYNNHIGFDNIYGRLNDLKVSFDQLVKIKEIDGLSEEINDIIPKVNRSIIPKAIGYSVTGDGLEIELGESNLITATLLYKNSQYIWYESGGKSSYIQPSFSNIENIVLTFTVQNARTHYIYYDVQNNSLDYTIDFDSIPLNSVILEVFYFFNGVTITIFTLTQNSHIGFDIVRSHINCMKATPEQLKKIEDIDKINAPFPYSAKIFMQIGCIGDSYTAGYQKTEGSTVLTNENYSWPHYISNITGHRWVNFGVSGSSSKSWVDEKPNYNKMNELRATRCQAYIIGLMINDRNSSSGQYVPLGDITDIGKEPGESAGQTNSYYAYYYKLIQLIIGTNGINSKAIVFCNTCPKSGTTYNNYNQAVRDIVSYCRNNGQTNVWLCDLAQNYNNKYYYQNEVFVADAVDGHYTGIGYEFMAECTLKIISDVMNLNVSSFQEVEAIPYDNPT